MFEHNYIKNVSTLTLDVDKCTGCLKCIEVCPHAVFILKNKKAFITNKDKCMECGACLINCADNAIFVRSGVGCASGIINGILRNTEPTCGCSSDGSSACC